MATTTSTTPTRTQTQTIQPSPKITLTNTAPSLNSTPVPSDQCREVTIVLADREYRKPYAFYYRSDDAVSKLQTLYRRVTGTGGNVLSFWYKGERIWSHQTWWEVDPGETYFVLQVQDEVVPWRREREYQRWREWDESVGGMRDDYDEVLVQQTPKSEQKVDDDDDELVVCGHCPSPFGRRDSER